MSKVKKAYQTLKILKKSTMGKIIIILYKNNRPVAENASLLKTWTEYCKALYNYKIRPDNNKVSPLIDVSNNTILF